MEQNKVQATTGITFRILVALSICHCLNDTLQSVISAVYPLFKEDLGLSFAQIGLITLVYQSAASVCQPLTGLFFDKWRPLRAEAYCLVYDPGFYCNDGDDPCWALV